MISKYNTVMCEYTSLAYGKKLNDARHKLEYVLDTCNSLLVIITFAMRSL